MNQKYVAKTTDELYEEYLEARNKFWQTYDRLASEGVKDIRSHPDCESADKTTHEAYSKWLSVARDED
jgi:hypothetical protein